MSKDQYEENKRLRAELDGLYAERREAYQDRQSAEEKAHDRAKADAMFIANQLCAFFNGKASLSVSPGNHEGSLMIFFVPQQNV